MGGFCCRIAASQRASQGYPIRGHRYEPGLHQGGERQPRERAGGVRQVPCHPECCGGLRPNSEDRDPGRCRKARSAGTDAVDVAEEPGELDGEGNPEVGVDGSGTVCDGHGLRGEAGPSGYLPMGGCGRSQEGVRELVRMGTGDKGADRGVARSDGRRRPDDRSALGGCSGPLDLRSDGGLHGGTQQLVLGCEAQGPRISVGRIHDHCALLRRQ